MTAHELARILLDGPDVEVLICDTAQQDSFPPAVHMGAGDDFVFIEPKSQP